MSCVFTSAGSAGLECHAFFQLRGRAPFGVIKLYNQKGWGRKAGPTEARQLVSIVIKGMCSDGVLPLALQCPLVLFVISDLLRLVVAPLPPGGSDTE
jgi:hypothetical protein